MDELDEDVRELLDSCIDSVEGLRLFLVLLAAPSRRWQLPELAEVLGVSISQASMAFEELGARGLAEAQGWGSAVGLAQLGSGSLAAFTTLAQACTTHRAATLEYLQRRVLHHDRLHQLRRHRRA